MRTYQLRMNYANLVNQIKGDYSEWLDRFNRVFASCLLIMEYQGAITFSHISLENKVYDSMYKTARMTGDLRSALQAMQVMTDYEITLTTDMLPMVEDFMKMKYINTRQNHILLHLDHLANVHARLTSVPFNNLCVKYA